MPIAIALATSLTCKVVDIAPHQILTFFSKKLSHSEYLQLNPSLFSNNYRSPNKVPNLNIIEFLFFRIFFHFNFELA